MVHQVHIMVMTVLSCGNLYCNNNSFHKHTCCDYTNNNIVAFVTGGPGSPPMAGGG